MKINLTPEQDLAIESSIVSLRGLRPVLNGQPLDGARMEIAQNDAARIELRYTAPALGDGCFGLEIARENESRAWLRYWIERLPDTFVLDSFGIRFDRVEKRTYALAALGLADVQYGYDWTRQTFEVLRSTPEAKRSGAETSKVSVTLGAHDSALFFFSPTPIPPPLSDGGGPGWGSPPERLP